MSEPSSSQTISLHPAQLQFLQSSAKFRGFCGGIGSGKTWCGCYDLVKRAQAGRLYMCVSPTFGMLSDSTLRTFISLGDRLGVLAEVKRSAPPSIQLKTGAEVLFRSGDEGDRLRGANLSGVFMDEASLMDESVFQVLIGRLREDGQQGWLTACFTPKGKRNYTYRVFGQNNPDTAVFFAATAQNPFLPPDFACTVARQYTSLLREQELQGRFVDLEGTMFKRGWFQVVDHAPPLTRLTRSWDLASTAAAEGKDPDWTVGPLLGLAQNKDAYIADMKRIQGTPATVEGLILRTAHADGRACQIVMEEEGGSSGKAVISHYSRQLLGFDFRGVRSTGSKQTRAMPLAAFSEYGGVKLVRGAWNEALLDELESFPHAWHDDIVDALSLGFSRLARQDVSCSDPVVLIPPPCRMGFDQNWPEDDYYVTRQQTWIDAGLDQLHGDRQGPLWAP
jgi:predicted phage terminase large subunit-like protein